MADPGPEQDLRDGHAGRTGAGDGDVEVSEVATDDASRIDQCGEHDDRGAVLVIVEDGDVEALLQPAFDLEAARRRDVLEVDPAIRWCDSRDGVHELVDGAGLHAQRDRVDTAEPLEQHGFSLHHRHGGERSDVSETKDRGAVADHSHRVAGAGVHRGQLRVRRDRPGDLGNARRVQERQVRGVAQWLGRDRGELAAQVRAEHRAGRVDERRGLWVHERHLGWLSGRATAGRLWECSRGGGHESEFRRRVSRRVPILCQKRITDG
jgi:hypothetical protein